jgi:hypothetical protein
MFAKAIAEPNEKRYLFNISKYYKIWYSPNRDVFLGIENQLRFVRMRHNNPDAAQFFIYSKACLSDDAHDALQRFCELYSLSPIAFEDLECQLVTENDKAMYLHAKEEINRTLNNTGGNLAAASDCTRHLEYVIQNYSIYTDLDVDTSLSKLSQGNENYISIRGPILLNSELICVSHDKLAFTPNTDFLAFGFDASNSKVLSEDALLAIHAIQTLIIDNYKLPFDFKKISQNHEMKKMSGRYPEMPQLFESFHYQYPENPTLFDFRMYLSSLPDEVMQEKEPIKHFLMKHSVINISGPGNCYAYFKHLAPKCKNIAGLIPYTEEQWLPFLKMVERCSIGFYDPIYDLIDTSNRISAFKTDTNERRADFSWTKEGADAQRCREIQILNTSITLQRACRRYRLWQEDPHELLYVKIRAICNDKSLLIALIDHNYALVLRKSCSQLKLPIIKLLLEYKATKGITFEVNAPSSSNQSTALDWAIEAKPKNQAGKTIQESIIKLLRLSGGMTKLEIVQQLMDSEPKGFI